MNVLVIAAHPDDEVLGCGATMKKLADEGHSVYVLIASHISATREEDIAAKALQSDKMLGVKRTILGDLECMSFKDSGHHEVVMMIEDAIRDTKPEVVFMHHPADIHIDHKVLAECTLEAIRLPQRQIDDTQPIKRALFMEVPSSTDWSADFSAAGFNPNSYEQVSWEDVDAKIKAISLYDGVVRMQPHPRSPEAIRSLATVRGAKFGVPMAEAFQQAFGTAI